MSHGHFELRDEPSLAPESSKTVQEQYADRFDLVIVFPRGSGGKRVVASRGLNGTTYTTFTQERFLTEMLGLRTSVRSEDGQRVEQEFMHGAARVMKTPRARAA